MYVWTKILQPHVANAIKDSFSISKFHDLPIVIAPGQSRPLPFKLNMERVCIKCQISFRVAYGIDGSFQTSYTREVALQIASRSIDEPHKITFLHPAGIVSYAILKPPPLIAEKESGIDQPLPILLNLHGAGLEADSHQVRHMLDSISDISAWVIFPTGGSPWSGDDWRMFAGLLSISSLLILPQILGASTMLRLLYLPFPSGSKGWIGWDLASKWTSGLSLDIRMEVGLSHPICAPG